MLPVIILRLLVILGTSSTAYSKDLFAHVMVGILPSYTQSNWAKEISDAKASGIDAFALNIGVEDYTETQLGFAYAAAEADGTFKMFISFDFNHFKLPDNQDLIVTTINNHASSSAQYKIDGKALVTTFSGDTDSPDWSGIKSRTTIFLAPSWADPNTVGPNPQIDGGYPWNAWGTINNTGTADPSTVLINQDNYWVSVLGSKPYFAPISPWFFVHYPADVFDGKNWVFPTEDLFLTRWQRMLDISPYAIMQLTWNDYSESTYVAPLRSDPNLYPDGAQLWTSGMNHDGFRLIQNAFVKAYKAGTNSPVITTDNIVYWYRTRSKGAVCGDSTGRPSSYQLVSDTLFVATMLTSPAQLVVNSGGVTSTFNVAAGAVMTKVPIQVGQQSFQLNRNGGTVLSNTSTMQFSTGCPSNVYNFNVYVGVI